MISRPLVFCLAVAIFPVLATHVSAQEKGKAAPTQRDAKADAETQDADAKVKTEKATFGGGCFWCLEAVYERIPGVKSVVSGYAGGSVPNPSYEEVSTGQTGHAEVVQIEYDPETVTYEKLLEVFFKIHDPTTLNSQGPDIGTQYRSIILYHNDAQKAAAQKYYKTLTAGRAFRHPIVTELTPLSPFFEAEPYHQDYYRNHKTAPYCRINIAPKLKKLKLK